MHRNKKRLYRIFAIFLAFLLAVGHLQMPGKAIRIEPEDPITTEPEVLMTEDYSDQVDQGYLLLAETGTGDGDSEAGQDENQNEEESEEETQSEEQKPEEETQPEEQKPEEETQPDEQKPDEEKRQRSRIQKIIQAEILRIILMNQSQMAVSPEGRLRMKILREEISPEIMKQIQTVEMEPEIHREPERIPEIHREMEIRKMMAVRIPISRSRWNRTILIWKKVW